MSIKGKTPVAHKLIYLDYFETLCIESAPGKLGKFPCHLMDCSANIILNSSLLKLFLGMVKHYKSFQLKAKLLRVIGVLIRHATIIDHQNVQ